jgi:hypothetical protein
MKLCLHLQIRAYGVAFEGLRAIVRKQPRLEVPNTFINCMLHYGEGGIEGLYALFGDCPMHVTVVPPLDWAASEHAL